MRSTGSEHPPLLVILGPTAVGKTAVAIELANALDGEIVSADSRQIYRHMDIGTAKPTPEQRAAAPHHLIDVVDPNQNLSLADYLRMANASIAHIHARGKLPMLVGGTGQYITALVEGWDIPEVPPDDALRSELEAFAAAQGAEALHARLRAVDPASAARIEAQNVRRVIRALEVTQTTGIPFSAQRSKTPPNYATCTFGLTMDRARLNARADRRVDAMMEGGFLDEVARLLGMGYSRQLPSMSGLGYRQIAAHLLDGVALSEAVQATYIATHQFIRRQFIWFRGHDHGILWHDVESLDIRTLMENAARWLREGR